MQANIEFFAHQVDLPFENLQIISKWISKVADKENLKVNSISFVFCSDEYLLSVNQKFLNHDDYTDVITFFYHEKEDPVIGEIYISVDRVKENAEMLNVSFLDEIHRVIIHGVLHLIGYEDHNEEAKLVMRSKEDYYLSLRPH